MDLCPRNLLIANAHICNDSDRQCPVAGDGAGSHLEVEKLPIPSEPAACDGINPGRSFDSDIGLSQARREVRSRFLTEYDGSAGVFDGEAVVDGITDPDIVRACHFCTRVLRLQRPLDGTASLAQVGDLRSHV